MIVEIDQELVDVAYSFAERRSQDVKAYVSRGENSREKIKTDIVTGLLGEYAVAEVLSPDCTKPDTNIYDDKKKSYEADLKTENYDIHVKSQTIESVEKYGASWLLQRTDPIVTRPTDRDVLALTTVYPTGVVKILGFVKANDLKDNGLWESCRNLKYGKTKKALYFENIYNYVEEILV